VVKSSRINKPENMQKKFFLNLLKILFTLALLTILLTQINFSQLNDIIHQFSGKYIFLVIILTWLALWVNAVKWQLLLPEYKVLTLFRFNLIAIYYSLILPGQFLGELAKAYYLGKGKQDAEKIAASIIVDKLTGLIGILLIGLFGIHVTSQNLPPILNGSFQGIALLLILALLSAKILAIPSKQILHHWLPVRFQRIGQQLENLLDAWLIYLKMPKLLLNSILLGSIFQLMCVAIVTTLAVALNLPISWIDMCWVFSVVSLAVFLPLTIAGIGIREGAFVGTLSLLNIPLEQGLALSLSVFGLNLLTALIGGLIELNPLKVPTK